MWVEAVQLRVAEQYVEQFGNLAKTTRALTSGPWPRVVIRPIGEVSRVPNV